MKASMRPSGDRVGDTAESVKLVSGVYSKRAVEEACRDQTAMPTVAATIAIAATPAAAKVKLRLKIHAQHAQAQCLREFQFESKGGIQQLLRIAALGVEVEVVFRDLQRIDPLFVPPAFGDEKTDRLVHYLLLLVLVGDSLTRGD